VVISIISLLSSVVLSSLSLARERAQKAQIVATLNNLKSAVELFYQDTGSWPFELDNDLEAVTGFDQYMSGDWAAPFSATVQITANGAGIFCGEGTPTIPTGFIIYSNQNILWDFGDVDYINIANNTYSGPSGVSHNGNGANTSPNIICVTQG